MVLREIRRKLAGDPFLKVGIVAMILALALAGVAAFIAFTEESQQAVAARSSAEPIHEPLVRSEPDADPWVEPEVTSPVTSPEPESKSGDAPEQTLPLDENNYPLPTNEQLRSTDHQRHYHLPPGAIMSLTIDSLGLHNAPVLDSMTTRALDKGVVHLPDTSLPWSDTPERNVYLAGHRLGWPGTGSHLVFYRLNQLRGGERVTLRGPQGGRYDYMVIESFVVGPEDSWITGRVRGRDLLTLQTCTPIPTFEKRLIVRAERI